jgi:hypothetical protein
MFTTNIIRAWSPNTRHTAFVLLDILWKNKEVPEGWADGVLCPIPKKPGDTTLQNMRPIGLLEVIRKVWTGIIIRRIQAQWDKRSLLHPLWHRYRWRNGTDTAIIRVLDAFELARETKKPLWVTLWDISKLFDSIAPNFMKLAWARLGIPPDVIHYLTSLGQGGLTFPWTPHMADNIEPRSRDELLQSDGHFVHQTDLMGFHEVSPRVTP